jgi:hypothetical protein
MFPFFVPQSVGNCDRRDTGEIKNGYRIYIGKLRRPFGTQGRRWKNYNKMDLKIISFYNLYSNHLAEDMHQWWALVDISMKLWVP